MVKSKHSLQRIIIYLLVLLFPVLPDFTTVANYASYDVLALGCVVLYFFARHRINKNNLKYLFKVFFCFIVFVSVVFIKQSAYMSLVRTLLQVFFVSYVIFDWCDNYNKLYDLLKIVLGMGLFCSIGGIIEVVFNYNIWGLIQTLDHSNPMGVFITNTRYGFVRIEGPFGQPLPFSVYLLFVNIVSIVIMLNGGMNKKSVQLAKIVWMLSSICIFFTFARTQFFLFLIIQSIFILQFKPKLRIGVILGMCVLSPLLLLTDPESNIILDMVRTILALIFPALNDKISDAGSAVYRLSLFENVLNYVKGNILFGIGYENSLNFKTLVTTGSYDWYQSSIDNHFLSILLRYGLVGLIANISLLLAPIIEILKYAEGRMAKIKNDIFLKMWFWGFLSYFISMLSFAQMNDKNIFIVCFSLVLCYLRLRRREIK